MVEAEGGADEHGRTRRALLRDQSGRRAGEGGRQGGAGGGLPPRPPGSTPACRAQSTEHRQDFVMGWTEGVTGRERQARGAPGSPLCQHRIRGGESDSPGWVERGPGWCRLQRSLVSGRWQGRDLR